MQSISFTTRSSRWKQTKWTQVHFPAAVVKTRRTRNKANYRDIVKCASFQFRQLSLAHGKIIRDRDTKDIERTSSPVFPYLAKRQRDQSPGRRSLSMKRARLERRLQDDQRIREETVLDVLQLHEQPPRRCAWPNWEPGLHNIDITVFQWRAFRGIGQLPMILRTTMPDPSRSFLIKDFCENCWLSTTLKDRPLTGLGGPGVHQKPQRFHSSIFQNFGVSTPMRYLAISCKGWLNFKPVAMGRFLNSSTVMTVKKLLWESITPSVKETLEARLFWSTHVSPVFYFPSFTSPRLISSARIKSFGGQPHESRLTGNYLHIIWKQHNPHRFWLYVGHAIDLKKIESRAMKT